MIHDRIEKQLFHTERIDMSQEVSGSDVEEQQTTEEKEVPAEQDADGGEERAPKPVPKLSRKQQFFMIMNTAVWPVLVSGILRALGIYIFVTPNNFAPGGTNGIAVLIEYATHGVFNAGYTLLLISIPLFFLAFFFIGKKEAIVSFFSFFITSAILTPIGWIEEALGVEHLLPIYGGPDASAQPIIHGLLGAVAGGIFLGVALAVMLKQCGTSGGTSIPATIINKKFRNLSVSMLTSLFDAVVVFVSMFVFGGETFTEMLDPVILALVSLFVTSKVCDTILQGFKSAYKFEIITSHPDELSEEIMQKLHRGVTCVNVEGMYSHENKSMLICVIRKRQLAELQRIIRRYPGSFAYFVPTNEVYGRFLK